MIKRKRRGRYMYISVSDQKNATKIAELQNTQTNMQTNTQTNTQTNIKLKYIEGSPANAGEIEDRGYEVYKIIGGKHNNHILKIQTAKYNCGAYEFNADCSCGSYFRNYMSGCWQYGHKRDEEISDDFEEIVKLIY